MKSSNVWHSAGSFPANASALPIWFMSSTAGLFSASINSGWSNANLSSGNRSLATRSTGVAAFAGSASADNASMNRHVVSSRVLACRSERSGDCTVSINFFARSPRCQRSAVPAREGSGSANGRRSIRDCAVEVPRLALASCRKDWKTPCLDEAAPSRLVSGGAIDRQTVNGFLIG